MYILLIDRYKICGKDSLIRLVICLVVLAVKFEPRFTTQFFTAILQPFHDHFTAISRPFYSHFTTILQPFHNHFTAILQPFHNHFTAILLTTLFTTFYHPPEQNQHGNLITVISTNFSRPIPDLDSGFSLDIIGLHSIPSKCICRG